MLHVENDNTAVVITKSQAPPPQSNKRAGVSLVTVIGQLFTVMF